MTSVDGKTFSDPAGWIWVFPDGARKHVHHNLNAASARHLTGWVKNRYGSNYRPVFDGDRVKGPKPIIDLTRLTASQHAQDRLALMRRQDNLTFEEVLLALRAPEKVLWSDTHHSWIWVRDRVGVAAHVDRAGNAVIATLLWATRELWDANPRPMERKR
ncbi:hypothetical protein [Microbacterium jejuense]|uniref:hypothetical protein n=1 Tax=Microbacterium jejuense TaxID=1263637 RepID=UPI0031ECC9D5